MPDLCFSDIGEFSDNDIKEMLKQEVVKMFGTDAPEVGHGEKTHGFKPLTPSGPVGQARIPKIFNRLAAFIGLLTQRPQKHPPM